VNDLGDGVNNLVEVIRLGEGVNAGLVGLSGLRAGLVGLSGLRTGLVGLSDLRAGIAGFVGVDSFRGVNTDCLVGGESLRGVNGVYLVGVLHGLAAGLGSGLREFVVVWVSFECSAP
jgi:hypothetical protein